MSESQAPKTVHLVGSIGLDTVDDVMRTVGGLLGPYLRRIPDGEVGGRRLWISWQYPLLRSSVFLRPDPSGAVRPTNRFPLLTLAEGVAPSEVRFGELGYAREARASYLDFAAARDKGEVPRGVRFQVCLPTPFAVVSSVVVADALPAVEAAYERAMIAEVAAICRHIPHGDLCLQWDLCNEMVIWDGQPTEAVPHAGEPRSAWCMPGTGSRAPMRASRPRGATHQISALPPSAAWRAPVRTQPCARCSRFIPTFARVIESGDSGREASIGAVGMSARNQ